MGRKKRSRDRSRDESINKIMKKLQKLEEKVGKKRRRLPSTESESQESDDVDLNSQNDLENNSDCSNGKCIFIFF